MIHVVVPAAKAYIFEEYLGHWGSEVSGRFRLHTFEDLPDQRAFERGTWLFTNLDELQPPVLVLVEALRDALVEAGVTILNDPRRVLRRRALLETLHARGINRFRATGLDGDLEDLRYPVFVRRASDHLGPLSPLLHSRRELDRWIGKALVWGASPEDVLVVEFLDTSGPGGLYRKYGAFVLDGRIHPRSLNRSTAWMVKHGTTDFTVDFQTEELEYVEDNPHRETLEEVVELAGVDYGRVDYGILDGRVQVWEVNLCPTIGRGARPSTTPMPEEVRAIRRRAKERFYAGFAEAWAAVDVAPEGPPIPAPFTEDRRRAARESMEELPAVWEQPERFVFLRELLQPLKPVLQPVVDRAVMPILGRLARARR